MNKSFIGKKLLSLLLSVLMCLSLIPTVAFATTAEGETVLVSTEEALKNALTDGGSIKLENDIELTAAQTITNDVTIDLNGKTISSTVDGFLTLNGGSLTVDDTVGGGGGE